MKSLKTRICEYTLYESELKESRLYEGFYKNAGGLLMPTSKEELMETILKLFESGVTNLNGINTSKITDMSLLFNILSREKVSSKIDMSKIDISLWDVSNVEYMHNMFYDCKDFNCDLSKWDVSNAVDMHNMFSGCKNFNCDLSKWNVSKVEDMNFAFDGSDVVSLPEWYRDNREE